MKQIIINRDLTTDFENGIPIPIPTDWEVVIKVEAVSINPVDWKASMRRPANERKPMGYDFAGHVHALGAKVFQLKIGDRVSGFSNGGGFAEYSVSPSSTTIKLPGHISFEEAVSYGLAYYTAALGLFKEMPAPTPWNPSRSSDHNPLLVYGASSAVGAYAVQLAVQANIHPIVAVAGAAAEDTVASILRPDWKDALVDYRRHETPESLVTAIEDAAGGSKPFKFVFDAISTEYTIDNVVAHVLDSKGSYFTYATPHADTSSIPATTQARRIFAPGLFIPTDPAGNDGTNDRDNLASRAFTSVASKYLEFALGERLLKVQPYKVLPDGLNSLQQGLQDLKEGKSNSRKYVMRIAETKW